MESTRNAPGPFKPDLLRQVVNHGFSHILSLPHALSSACFSGRGGPVIPHDITLDMGAWPGVEGGSSAVVCRNKTRMSRNIPKDPMNDEKDSAPRNPSMAIKPEKKATNPNYPALVIVGVGAAAACTALALECCQRTDDKCPQFIKEGAPRIKIERIPEQELPGLYGPRLWDAAQEDAAARSERDERNEPVDSASASD